MEFDELKNMWNNKTAQVVPELNNDTAAVMDRIISIEKKTKAKYIIASLAMSIELLFFLVLISVGNLFYGVSLAGILLIIIAVFLGGISIWSTNIVFNQNDLKNPGIDFLRKIKDKFERRKFLRIYVIPAYLVMIAFGVTMIFQQKLSGLSAEWKVLVYSISYLYILFVYLITARKEIRKEKSEIEPLKKDISGLIEELEADK